MKAHAVPPVTAAALLAGILSLSPTSGASAQALEVLPDTRRVTVGEPLTLEVRARLPAAALPLDRAPAPRGPLPEGLRILSAGRLRRQEGGSLVAKVRVAFFRPGRQSFPQLTLAYGPSSGARADTLLSAATAIEVMPVLPPGDQALKDIKDLVAGPGKRPLLLYLAILAVALLAAYALLRRLRRRSLQAPPPPAPAPAGDPRSSYEIALERLGRLERARLPARGEVAMHYVLVVDVLRRYLEEGHDLPALERTTGELLWSLPPALGGDGPRETCRELLEEADLVKFARLLPGEAAAGEFLGRTREMLERWESASRSVQPVPAGMGVEEGR